MKNWYENSIKSLVEEYFSLHGFNITFNTSLFWDENLKMWKQHIPPSQLKRFSQVATSARNYAFNVKYGSYNYSNDYRSVCPNWSSIIRNVILNRLTDHDLANKKVLAVGANNGLELSMIFEHDYYNMHFHVVEISKEACENGKNHFPEIEFTCASMDEVKLASNNYDIFICLRAAYCAGNNLDEIVKRAIYSVKNGGIILFSISNGYIDISNGMRKPIKGVYNPEILDSNENETVKNLNWMKDAMKKNACETIDIIDAESEILLVSTKL